MKNGNIYDIGQTVNGVSTFLWFEGNWYYYTPNMDKRSLLYEYPQEDLSKLVLENEYEEVKLIGNILQLHSEDDVAGSSSYCQECDSCGEEGCCTPLRCTLKENCKYGETYLQHLKFGYKMYNYFEEEIISDLPLDVQDKIDERWNKIYDETYK